MFLKHSVEQFFLEIVKIGGFSEISGTRRMLGGPGGAKKGRKD